MGNLGRSNKETVMQIRQIKVGPPHRDSIVEGFNVFWLLKSVFDNNLNPAFFNKTLSISGPSLEVAMAHIYRKDARISAVPLNYGTI